MQDRQNSIANALEIRLSCTNPSIYSDVYQQCWQVTFNLSPPSAAWMHQRTQSALVQIMACHLNSAKPLPEPRFTYCNWTLRNTFQWNSNQKTKIFIHENSSENIICEMAAILRGGDKLTQMEHKFIVLQANKYQDLLCNKVSIYHTPLH